MERQHILIEPKDPENIGASARAMKNIGFRSLQLINPCDHLADEARQMACKSGDILKKALILNEVNRKF
jgi:tRNA/rRNA methyltransferase